MEARRGTRDGWAAAVSRPSAENAVVNERGVNLRLACWPVELDVRATAAKEVPAVRTTRADRVLREDHSRRPRCSAVGRLVQTDRGRAWRRKATALYGR